MKISDNLKLKIKVSAFLTALTVFGLFCSSPCALANEINNLSGHTTGFAASTNADFGPYMKRMQDKIKSNWAPPDVNMNAQIVVKYRILRNGTLDSYGISTSSGSQELDNAAIDALRRSSPFEPLPASFEKESVLVQFTFDYQKPAHAANSTQSTPVQQTAAQQQTYTRPAVASAPQKIQTLAISPFGDAQATTSAYTQQQAAYQPATTYTRQTEYPQQDYTPVVQTTTHPQSDISSGQPRQTFPVKRAQTTAQNTKKTGKKAKTASESSKPQPYIYTAQNTAQHAATYTTPQTLTVQPRVTNVAGNIPVRVDNQAGTLSVGTPPPAGYQAAQTTPIRYTGTKTASATRPVIRHSATADKPSNAPVIRTASSNTATGIYNNQYYTNGTALPEPAVNPRRTVNIDTFAAPDKLQITIPVTQDSGKIASKPTVVNAQTPVNAQEINRIALPETYDPEIEQVVVDEDDLPPIETPTLTTGINKVAIPPHRTKVRQTVTVPVERYEETPAYVAAPPPQTYAQKPVQVTPVRVPDFAAYMAKVQRKITKKWHPPLSDYSTKVVVNYIINKNGDLGNYYIAESSGNSRMDVSATKALEKAAPFPPLPAGFDEDSVDVKFTFDYNVYKNKSEKRGIKEMEKDEDD